MRLPILKTFLIHKKAFFLFLGGITFIVLLVSGRYGFSQEDRALNSPPVPLSQAVPIRLVSAQSDSAALTQNDSETENIIESKPTNVPSQIDSEKNEKVPSDKGAISPYMPIEAVSTPTFDVPITVTQKNVYSRETTFYRFSNGLSLFVQKNHSGLATVRAYIQKTGSQWESEYLGTGISHLTEHLVCGGSTSKRTEAETREILDRLGGNFNAFTGKEITGYYIDCLSTAIPTALDLVASWMTDCAFDPAEFSREKRVILQEILDGESNPKNVMSELLCQTVYRESPYRHPIGGYPDLFTLLTRDDVCRFYKSHYIPNQTIYFVAGDVNPDEIADKLAVLYAGKDRGRELEIVLASEPAQIAPREAVREMDVTNFQLLLAWPTITLSEPDLYALDVLEILLTGGESARLNRFVKNEKGLGISFNASSLTPADIRGFFAIQTEIEPEKLETVQTEILDQLQRLREVPPSSEELNRVKKKAEAAFILGRETLSSVADSYVSNYLATGDPDFDQHYLDGLRKVSAGDITRVIERYFKTETQSRVLIAPKGMAPTNVSTESVETDSKIAAYQIPGNELRMFLKRSTTLPMVNIQIYVPASGLTDKDATAGRTALLAEMLDKGSQNYSRSQIENYFDSIGGTLSFGAGRYTLITKMTVLKEDYQNALKVLADLLLHPTFPEEELIKAKKAQKDRIASQTDSPAGEIFQFFTKNLPQTTPYHLPINGTVKSVDSLSAEDLRRFHRQIIVPQRMVITLFGDINVQEAANTVKELFEGIPKGENLIEISYDHSNSFIKAPNVHKKTQKKTGLGIAAWPTVSIRDEEENAALTVLQTILGGYGSPGGRLFEDLRGDGLVYRLSVNQMSGPSPGYFCVFFETRPDKVQEIFQRIDQAVERIKDGDLSDEEVTRAKERIIAFHPHEMETLSECAEQAALNDLYGLGFNYDDQFKDRISGVTREQVIEAAQKYFSQRAQISTSPLEKR